MNTRGKPRLGSGVPALESWGGFVEVSGGRGHRVALGGAMKRFWLQILAGYGIYVRVLIIELGFAKKGILRSVRPGNHIGQFVGDIQKSASVITQIDNELLYIGGCETFHSEQQSLLRRRDMAVEQQVTG